MLRTLGRRRVGVVHGSTLVAAILRVGVVVIGIVGRQRSLLLTLFNAGLLSVRHDVYVCVVVLKKGGKGAARSLTCVGLDFWRCVKCGRPGRDGYGR